LRIWFCNYSNIEAIAQCENLQELVIAGLKGDKLDFLSRLSQLKYLSIAHITNINDLSPISNLQQLECLSLETPRSWNTSRKRYLVNSLEPLAQLGKLRHLQLYRVCNEALSLASLEQSSSLRTVRLSGYTKKETARFYKATQFVTARGPESSFEISNSL